MSQTIGWIGSIGCVLAFVLNSRQSIWCWVWLACISLLMFVNWGNWPIIGMFAVYQAINVYGWMTWHRLRRGTRHE